MRDEGIQESTNRARVACTLRLELHSRWRCGLITILTIINDNVNFRGGSGRVREGGREGGREGAGRNEKKLKKLTRDIFLRV